MNIRPLEPKDIEAIKRIHGHYFINDFAFPDFFNKFLCRFVIEGDDRVICAAGVRTIAESIMITDQDITAREKRDILLQALDISTYMANQHDFTQLHAFVQGDIWNSILRKVGFRNCKGNALVIDCR